MQKWPDDCIDLIYLDPPFKSDTNYNILFGTQNGKPAQLQAFEDTWYWNEKAHERVENLKGAIAHPAHKPIAGLHLMLGDCGMLAYLSYMAERLAEMKRLLKPTGSIYLHCDPSASHYLKTIMDGIFDGRNFRNEIVWKRRADKHNLATKTMGPLHDVILWYGDIEEANYNRQYTPYSKDYIDSHYKHKDERGNYRLLPCTNESGGNKPYEFRGVNRAWRFSKDRMEDMYDQNLLVQLKPEGPYYYKKYLKDAEGVPLQDLWDDISPCRGKESLGYPTQKPRALLERIINASCPPHGIVFDPFCGCGTAIDAAQRLNRQWLGVDISSFAIDLIVKERLQDRSIPVAGIPLDLTGAKRFAEADRFGFEKWAINRVPGFVPNEKQVGDGGIDGRAKLMNKWNDLNLALAQVKSGGLGGLASDARDFLHVMQREDAVCGVFITTEKIDGRKRSAHEEFESMGRFEIGANNYPRVQFWSIEEYFDGRFPNLPPMLNPYTGKPMAQIHLI
ncbi:MAG: site-specific DNA-methyltransferase [Gammaproteobacteria bacterium]|nr:site-specific DNA-methyltransferase [Gammaproteobacteria bacterium]